MQVLAFYSCHGKIIISEYCKVEVHGNVAYFSALHLKEPVVGLSRSPWERILPGPFKVLTEFSSVQL